MACFTLKVPVSKIPVLFSSVRWIAMARSVFVRKIAVAGESGRIGIRNKPNAAVTAPRIRNISCHSGRGVLVIWPMP